MNFKKKPLRLLLLVTVYAFVYLLMQTNVLAQSWYNPSWGYRKSVTVNNTSNPNALTNYQVKVSLNSSSFDFSKAQSGGQDIRFTASNGTTLIDHWIEGWNSVAQTATLWAEVPTVPGSGTAVVYMYFSNLGASSTSNGDATFNFFDGFSGQAGPPDVYGNWERVVVDNTYNGAHNVVIENVDGDNKPDLVADAYRASTVVWYKQPADPIHGTWTKYTIDNSLPNAHDCRVGDIDGDGRRDVVGLSLSANYADYNQAPGYICWYRKPVDPTTVPWTKTIIASSGSTGLLGARSFELGDIDSDGDLDIAVAVDANTYQTTGRLLWYQNPGGSNALDPAQWHEYLLDNTQINGAGAQIGDIDDDGNPDIVYSGYYTGGATSVYYAPADPTNVGGWVRVPVGRDTYRTALVDYDGDGDLDILLASFYGGVVSWVENPLPSQDPRIGVNWHEYILEQNATTQMTNRLWAGDIDGDGDLDIGMCSDPSGSTGYFKWYRRPANPRDVANYQIYTIDNNATYTAWAHDCFIGDVDNDGDIDMAGNAANANTVVWWVNEKKMPGDMLDVNKWNSGGSPTVSSGVLNITTGQYVQSKSSFQYKALRSRTQFLVGAPWGIVNMGFKMSTILIGQDDVAFTSWSTAPIYRTITAASNVWTWGYLPDEGASWKTWDALWKPDLVKFYVNDSLRTTHTSNIPTISLPVVANYNSGTATLNLDWILVRNYSSPEPGFTLGPSESAGQVSLIPGFQVDKPSDLDTVWVHLDNNLVGVEIATFKVTYDENYLTPTAVIDGPDLPPSHLVQSHIYPQDSILIDIGILEGHFDGPGSLVGIVLTADTLVDATHLDFARSILRDSSNQDIVHTAQGASIQIKDLTPPTVSVTSPPSGDTLNYRPTLTVVFHDDLGLNRGYYQIDGCTGGAWTSLWAYNSGSSDSIVNWTVPGVSQGSHSIHFKVTDDGGNINVDSCSYSWVFTYDSIPPAAPTGFAVLPGHKKCKLSWTNPTGPDFRGVEVRRNPWCSYAYPEYDDTCAALGYPGTHTHGDLVYQGLGTSFKDSSSTLPRNVYYYTIFSYDRAGNYSAATTAQQGRATNYWLGDVSGDGEVYSQDLGILSNAFWTSRGDPHYDAEFDIGPTSNMSPKGIPTTDNAINFEDLVIFAINFAAVGPNQKAVPILAGQDITGPLGLSLVMPEGGLQVGREFKLKVVLSNNPGTVKAIHFVLPYDPAQLEFIGVDQSAELKGASYPLFFDGRERGQQVDVSLALLGGNTAIGGSGQIASISFRLLQSKDLSLGFSQIDLRDGENNKLSGQGENAEYTAILQVPKAYGLSQNYPNPYNLQTQIAYQLPQSGLVLLKIYNIRGELVRTLVNEYKPAGYHTVSWDGKNGDGVAVSSGIYFYRLSSESFSATRKMVMLK